MPRFPRHASMREDNEPKDLRSRIRHFGGAMRHTPQALALVWEAHPLSAVMLPFLVIVTGVTPALSLYCGKMVIDGVTNWIGGGDVEAARHTVFLFVGLGFGAHILQDGLGRLSRYLEELLRLRLSHYVQNHILTRAISLDLGFFETPAFYDKLQRAESEAGFRPFAIMSALVRGARELVTLVAYVVTIATLDWWIVPALLLLLVPGLIVQTIFGRRGWRMLYHRAPEIRRMRYLQSVLTSDQNAKEVRLFGLATFLKELWRETFWKFYRQDRSLATKRHISEFAASMLETAGFVGFYSYVIFRTIVDPAVTVGSLFMYTQALERSVGVVGSVFRSVAGVYENNLYLGNLFDYLKQEPALKAPQNPVPPPRPLRHGIVFENVDFRYPGVSDEVLHGVSLEIGAGERVAFVGENGAGKTTMIKLLARLYDPTQGRIYADGTDLRDMDPAEWQSRIGVIFQDFVRYAMTARENIGFGQLEYLEDLDRIERAANLSGADRSIAGLHKGWETILGKVFEEGQELSGGEWQKVALARAFLREADILVLDEPTAALDAKQEYETFVRFNELTMGKTTILISHRFSTVRMADRIFVIENGAIAESGSHEELLEIDGRYAFLFNRQAAGYR